MRNSWSYTLPCNRFSLHIFWAPYAISQPSANRTDDGRKTFYPN